MFIKLPNVNSSGHTLVVVAQIETMRWINTAYKQYTKVSLLSGSEVDTTLVPEEIEKLIREMK